MGALAVEPPEHSGVRDAEAVLAADTADETPEQETQVVGELPEVGGADGLRPLAGSVGLGFGPLLSGVLGPETRVAPRGCVHAHSWTISARRL